MSSVIKVDKIQSDTGTVNLASSLSLSGTGNRITGDFSNATVTNRVAFQTSTTDGATIINTLPNGTNQAARFRAFNTADPTNSAFGDFGVSGTATIIQSNIQGTGSYLPMTFFTGGSERMRIDTSGNVGIGTGSPASKLEVSSSASNAIRSRSTSNNPVFELFADGYATAQFSIDRSTGVQLLGAGAIPMVFSTDSVERMRIDSSGNVGIGTSSPTAPLEIGRTINNNQIRLKASNGNVDLRINSGFGSADLASVGVVTNHSLMFATNNTERMRIDSSGNLLIGATSGGYKLTVVGGRGGFAGAQNVGSMLNASGALGGVECISAGGSDAAFMAFHRPGAYASYFGIDTDNYFAVGGWSAGAGLASFKCGALSKSSGSFKIDHPLPELTETHHLVHSFVEAPQADNIYRGKVELVNGRAEVNIDQAARMTEGTFVLLNREVQCFTSNESDWDAVRGSVNGNILSIECQNASSTATISWLVIGERQDKHMYDTDWTDENGKVIVEPLKTPTQMESN